MAACRHSQTIAKKYPLQRDIFREYFLKLTISYNAGSNDVILMRI